MKSSFKEIILNILSAVRDFFVRIFTSREAIVMIVLSVLFAIVAGRLFYLQIVRSDYYTENFTKKTSKTITSSAARGNIYDCNGYLLAYNKLSYSVTMTDEIPSSSKRGEIINGIVYRTIKIIEENGDSIIDDFNIELREGIYEFRENPVTRPVTFLINVYGLTSDEISEGGYDRLSAEEVMDYITGPKKFDISTEYTKEERLKVASVRYMLSLTAYQKYVATEIASDISERTKAAILECTDDLTGVEIAESYKRIYNDAEYFAHIIGYTGLISAEELEEYNSENETGITYTASDYVGKAGVEQSFDAYLQGKKGEKDVFVDATGNILEVVSETQSSLGNDIYLTIDRDLQVVAYTVLEKKLAACLINKIVDYDYKSLGDKKTYTYIPVKDVYHSILTNVIDCTEFDREDTCARAKIIYQMLLNRQSEVIDEIMAELANPYALPANELSDEMNDFMYLVYEHLGSSGILDKSLMDTGSDIYVKWSQESISLREFIQGAIASNWIDVTVLNTGGRYSNSDEVYEDIMTEIPDLILGSRDFTEMVYYYLIFNEKILPYNICMLLYDTGTLEKDDCYQQLYDGKLSTYDFVIEQIADLKLTPAMLGLDPCSGSLCLTDSSNGKVLALVSYPSYDNNLLSGHVDPDYWYELNYNDSQPLFNYATMALTPPGSTFKLCTSVAALSEGYITPDTKIYDDVVFKKVSPSPKCYVAPATHGTETLATAIRDSCNYFFFEMGYQMGLDSNGVYNSVDALNIITDYAQLIGLGTRSGVEISESMPRISVTDAVRTAIGQGKSGFATVQMTRYVNTIANSGTNYQLSLIDCVMSSSGEVVMQADPVVTNTVYLSQPDWDAIHEGMRLVTKEGTAMNFFTSLKTSVAGKTGTAEEDKYRSNHAAFVGYAPAAAPKVSFACMIRNSDSTSYPGGVLCDVLKYYFKETTFDEIMARPVENTISGFHSE